MKRTALVTATALALAGLMLGGTAIGSSHREAPLITETPKVDNTDFYMFRSYEPGREGYVTFIANFQPFQDSYGGPNYFTMDEDAIYAIHIDNDGDALPDKVFYFKFYNEQRNLRIPVNGESIPVPLSNIGPFGPGSEQNLNVIQRYVMVTIDPGENAELATNMSDGGVVFRKPFDNVGNKSVPEYEKYAGQHIYNAGLHGCAGTSRVFAGQRKEGFAVNIGEVFDLINTNPVGARDGETNSLENKNVTTIALEVPIACVTDGSPIIGAWSSAYKEIDGLGKLRQVSRLSAPLVNEVVIGLPDKDKFNASVPYSDGQFAKYVTNPTLPELIQALYPSVQAPNQFPRADLVAAFLTGIDGLNKPVNVRAAEMMRLNTSIAPTPVAEQNNLGVLGNDLAGFPNGRRPGDDVVDIELRVMMGALLPEDVAPSGQLPYTDGAAVSAQDFLNRFPYLDYPIPGSPSENYN